MVNIRDASEEDFEQIWEIFHQIVSAGETYAINRNASKIDAHKIEYFRGGSGDSPTSLTRSAFSQKLSRLRKNPPKILI